MLKSIEICAGAGGQALGLEQAGFDHAALVEIEKPACETLRANRPKWNVVEGDVHEFSAAPFKGAVDLLAGGVPCPPFSVAGKQLGSDDERDLFPEALRLVCECDPRAVMIENVRGIFYPKFSEYREMILGELHKMGYKTWWQLVLPHLPLELGISTVCTTLPSMNSRRPLRNTRMPTAGRTLWNNSTP